MCNVGALGLGLQGVGLVGNTLSSYIEDKTYNESVDRNIEYKNRLLLNNYAEQTRNINNAYSQDKLANAYKMQQNYINNMRQKASMQAGMASAGINGNSLSSLLRGYERTSAVNNYLSARDLHLRGLEYNDKLSNLRYSTMNTLVTNQYSADYRNTLIPTMASGTNRLFNSTLRYAYWDRRRNGNL